jgi:hypothetical protein
MSGRPTMLKLINETTAPALLKPSHTATNSDDYTITNKQTNKQKKKHGCESGKLPIDKLIVCGTNRGGSPSPSQHNRSSSLPLEWPVYSFNYI